MDEGFTEFATNLVEEYYRLQTSGGATTQLKSGSSTTALTLNNKNADSTELPLYHHPNYTGYLTLAKSGLEEPLTTHADHFNTNYAYSNASYSKGAVFMEQLGYIVGSQVRDKILLEYYRQWRFKHPDVNDFMRVAEKSSNIKLDWYKMYWVNTTKTIDYRVDSLYERNNATTVRLRRIGEVPMPIDVKITFRDGSSEWHYIPLNLMYGTKPAEEGQAPRTVYEAWRWTHPTYEIRSNKRLNDIVSVEIDPSHRMADIERRNNKLELKW
jgi:hypothetical protein